MDWRGWRAAIAAAATTLLFGLSARADLPRPAHVVIVIEENHSGDEILKPSSDPSSDAPFIRSLAAAGATFTNSHGIDHPSQPNYLALFSGSTQGVEDDDYPTPMTSPNLAAQLQAAGHTFVGYSEGLPSAGSTIENYSTDQSNRYVHKHNPWENWQADSPTGNQISPSTNQPFTSFPTNFNKLPTVSFVIPDEQNDMHDGTVAQGDQWMRNNLGSLAKQLAATNTLLIFTFDEDDGSTNNQIPTILVGKMIKPGTYTESINHHNILRTVESMYGLPGLGDAATTTQISDAFVSSPPMAVPEPTLVTTLTFSLTFSARRRRY